MSRRKRTNGVCRDLDDWPDIDRQAWQSALASQDEHSYGAAARSWAPASTHMVVRGYGRWLHWLDSTGQLDSALPPGQRVTRERLSSYVVFLREISVLPSAIARLEQLSKALRVMDPGGTWHEVQRLANAMRRERKAAAKADQDEGAVQAPPRGSGRSLRLAEWPEADRLAWTAALQPGDIFDPGGVALEWRDATLSITAEGYGYWLDWLDGERLLDPQQRPAQRVTTAVVSRYLDHLAASVAPYTQAAHIQQLGNAMRAMAPETDWGWLLRASGRLRLNARPVRNKRERLRSPSELVDLGHQLMQRAETEEFGQARHRAALFRDGLLIAFLAHRPIRRRNLASIVIGEHLRRCGTAWSVSFPGEETKSGQPLAFKFPETLLPALEIYLDVHRPVLAGRGCKGATSPSNALWMSAHGTPLGGSAIAHQIDLHTAAAFGAGLSPHLFRDCVATSIAVEAPEQIQSIRPILGHATLAISERHYNHATSLEASRRHGATVTELRKRSSRR